MPARCDGLTRRVLLAGALTGPVAAVAACRGERAPAGPEQSGARLSGTFELWQPWPIDQPTHGGPVGWKQLMDAYNAKGGPKVDIVTPPGQEGFGAKLLSAFAAGTPPDCYQVDGPGVTVYGGKGLAEPLNDLMARDKWDKSQLFAFSLDIMEWQGKYYAMMQHVDINFMWYNASHLEASGLDPKSLPRTFDQLETLAVRLTRRTADGFEQIGAVPHLGTDYRVVFPQANGAKLLSPDSRQVFFDAPEVVAAFEWIANVINRLGGWSAIDTWRANVAGASGSAANIFAIGRLSSLLNGNWQADNIRRLNRDLRFVVSPVPSGPAGPRDPVNNVYGGGILICATKGTSKLPLVWDFFKFTASKEGGLAVQRNTADVSGNKEAARDPEILNDPDTGLGRKEAYPLFDQARYLRYLKSPLATEIGQDLLNAVTPYLQGREGNLAGRLKEANRQAQLKLDEYWQQQK